MTDRELIERGAERAPHEGLAVGDAFPFDIQAAWDAIARAGGGRYEQFPLAGTTMTGESLDRLREIARQLLADA
jgi:hypothetical protein